MTQLSLLELLERPTLETLAAPDQIYTSSDWQFVVRQKENTRFDRKSARINSSGLADCLSAFGNGPAAEGGVIAIGIENDGTVTGCKNQTTERLQSLELMGRDYCPDGRFETRRVAVKNSDGEDDFIILARVHYVEDRLVALTNGNALCRESDRSRRLTEVEKQEVRINKGERAFELEPCPLSYPDEFRTSQVHQFCEQIRRSRDASTAIVNEEILESMRLGRIRGQSFIPNNICALLFARDPQQAFPGAYIHFLRFEGTEEKSGKEYNVSKDRMFQGTMLEVISDTARTVDASLREFTVYERSKFHQRPESPHDAWYELIVNACVHRSYHAKTQPIFVKMFDDHLTVESPGGFMPNVTPDNLFHKPRNPFLMFTLREYGEVRCISEGTKRIEREMQEASLPPAEYVGTPQSVIATLRNSLDSEAYKQLGEAIAFSLDPDERRMINYVMEHGTINVSDALRILSTTYWHTAKAKLQRLVKRGVLDFVSTKSRDPKAHYTLRRRESD